MDVRIRSLSCSTEEFAGRESLELLHFLFTARTIPVSYTRWAQTEPPCQLAADFLIGPGFGGYEVRYECRLAVERPEQARTAGREPQPYCLEERLTYLDQETNRRKKAFDTVGLNHYQGIHPLDILHTLAHNRYEYAKICAVRLLAERLGRSFLFFEDFRLLAQKTRRLRPGAYFLNMLHAFASQPEFLCIKPWDKPQGDSAVC